MRKVSVVLLLLFCFSTGVIAASKKSLSKSWGDSPHKKVVHRPVHRVKALKKKKVYRVVVLQPFTEPFKYEDYEDQCWDVSRNTIAIFQYIRKLNSSVSQDDAQLMASNLALQGEAKEIDPKFVAAVMSVESRFNKRAYHNGAMGLGQLMRGTARSLGITDPYDIAQNVQGTTQYIKTQLDVYPDSDFRAQLALSCYLLGPLAVQRSHQRFDTRVHAYVRAVLGHYTSLIQNYDHVDLETLEEQEPVSAPEPEPEPEPAQDADTKWVVMPDSERLALEQFELTFCRNMFGKQL